MLAIALTLHLLSAVVWVGGMFAAYLCLRPAAGPLEAPQRLSLWRRFFAKFFLWVWASVVLLLATGIWMVMASKNSWTPPGTPVEVTLARRKNARAMTMTPAMAVDSTVSTLTVRPNHFCSMW